MDLDAASLRLLEYMATRVSATVSDNQERIARALELSPELLAGAMEDLCARELLNRERMEGSAFVLRITSKGSTLVQEHRLRLPPVRKSWRKLLDPLAALLVRASVVLRHAWQDRRTRPPSPEGRQS